MLDVRISITESGRHFEKLAEPNRCRIGEGLGYGMRILNEMFQCNSMASFGVVVMKAENRQNGGQIQRTE